MQPALEGRRSLSRGFDSAITRCPGRLPRAWAQFKADYALMADEVGYVVVDALYMVIPPYRWNGRLGSLVKKEACGPIRQHPLPHGIETREARKTW